MSKRSETIFLVFHAYHRYQTFIGAFSEKSMAELYVSRGNRPGQDPFSGYYIEEVTLDSFVEMLKNDVANFTVVMSSSAKILYCTKSKDVPVDLDLTEDVISTICKGEFETYYTRTAKDGEYDYETRYLRLSVNAANEDQAKDFAKDLFEKHKERLGDDDVISGSD